MGEDRPGYRRCKWGMALVDYFNISGADPAPGPRAHCQYPGCRTLLSERNNTGYCDPHQSPKIKDGKIGRGKKRGSQPQYSFPKRQYPCGEEKCEFVHGSNVTGEDCQRFCPKLR